ncbi:MAG: 3-hydroxybutyryl-CoA dehydrogenase, partial [Bacteroidia bacterium]|nr:3-hydroxybutyryl-CoA dehydrogenase [Bacteroidia bacterium]
AQVCAQAGYKTLLFDVNIDLLGKAIEFIENNLKVATERGKLIHNEKEEIQRRIIVVNQLDDIKADLIIEAVVEKLEVKQNLFQKLEKINQYKSILATNTSSISVTQIASVLKYPANCIGLHFFNPAHRMKLVEVISGSATDPKLVDVLKEFSRKLGKTSVVAKDSPGFIVNRVARHYYVESLKVLEENVAPVGTIDKLLRSAGFKMGPFELMDLIGIDTNLAVTTSVYNGFHQDSKFRPSPLQQQKVDAGHLGRKSGRGFYEYPKN